jgi:hypothetical protein
MYAMKNGTQAICKTILEGDSTVYNLHREVPNYNNTFGVDM